MIFDINNLFYHQGTAFAMTTGEYGSLATVSSSFASASAVINMGVAQDMGIGDGEAVPKLGLFIGTAVTSSCSSLTLNFMFQGSTDSVTWTTYSETGNLTTASFGAGANVFPQSVPKRPAGAALPKYYRIRLLTSENVTTAVGATISTGTIIGGIILQRDDNDDTGGLYPSGFTVV